MKAWLLACLCLHAALADNPGLQVSLTEDTLNTGLFIFYAFYLSSASFFIGDLNFTLPVLGAELDIKLTNINITSVSLDYANSAFTLESPNILTYTITDLVVDATAGYDVKLGLIHPDPGQASVTLSATNATVALALSSTLAKPQIHFTNVELKAGDIAIATKLPKEINEIISKEVHDQVAGLEKKIASLASSEEVKINALLESLNLVISCPVEPLAVDLGLVLGPQILNDSILVVGLNGTILADGVAVPSSPAVSAPVNAVVSEGLQVALTDFVINSVLQSVWSTLSYTVDSLPASLNMPLTTDTLSLFIPQFRLDYGSGKAMKLNLYANSSNYISYWTDSSFFVNASTFMDFYVNVSNNWQNVLTLEVTANVEVNASVTDNAATLIVTSLQVSDLVLKKTAMKNVNVGAMKTLLNQLISVVLDEMNPLLDNYALNLPDGIGSFVVTDNVEAATGYLVLGADI